MQMGMMEQVLPPGVQHGDEADLGPQMGGIGRDDPQGVRRGPEEDAVDPRLVLVRDGRNRLRHSEDDVEVLRVQQLGVPVLDPRGPGQGLALGAMPIATRVVANPVVVAVITLLDMAAEGGRPAVLDRGHDAPLGGRQRAVLLGTIGVAIAAEDVRHFQRRALHRPGG
jgi:hypothetical protein